MVDPESSQQRRSRFAGRRESLGSIGQGATFVVVIGGMLTTIVAGISGCFTPQAAGIKAATPTGSGNSESMHFSLTEAVGSNANAGFKIMQSDSPRSPYDPDVAGASAVTFTVQSKASGVDKYNPVSSAAVTFTDEGTNRLQVTNTEGTTFFRFNTSGTDKWLRPGTYRVSVAAPGFYTKIKTDLHVHPGQSLYVTVTLRTEPGTKAPASK